MSVITGHMHAFLLRLFPSLAKKVALAVVLGSLIAWGTFVFFARHTGYQILENQSQIKARGLARLVSEILRHAGERGGVGDLGDVLKHTIVSSDIRNAVLLAQDGTVAWSARPPDTTVLRLLQEIRERKSGLADNYVRYSVNDSDFALIVEPLRIAPADSTRQPQPQYVALDISMADVRATAIEHRTTNIVLTIVIFSGLGIFLYVLLSILVIRPMRRLRGNIAHVESAIDRFEYTEKTELPSLAVPGYRDEIDELYRVLNRLIERINIANERLTEMHQTELEHADRLATVGEMAAGMAHEIKNPVAGVLGALQVFQGEAGVTADRKEILAEMMNQLERVTHAVNDLLQYARPTPPHFEMCDLHEIIDRTIGLLTRQFRSNGVAAKREFSSGPITLPADRKQLQQVIWNLLLNAFQAIEGSGSVSVRTSAEGESVSISIADTGKGISSGEMENIFKPFFTTKHKGTGLGMTISRRIVEQHRGTISVTSDAGKGTLVTIILPCRQEKEPGHAR